MTSAQSSKARSNQSQEVHCPVRVATEDYQPTPETSSTPFAARKRALKEHTRSSKRRHRASVAGLTQLRQEEADIYEARQRSQWRRIFDLFDDDGEGSIDRNEMRDLMRKFSPEATIDEIEAVCDALDSRQRRRYFF